MKFFLDFVKIELHRYRDECNDRLHRINLHVLAVLIALLLGKGKCLFHITDLHRPFRTMSNSLEKVNFEHNWKLRSNLLVRENNEYLGTVRSPRFVTVWNGGLYFRWFVKLVCRPISPKQIRNQIFEGSPLQEFRFFLVYDWGPKSIIEKVEFKIKILPKSSTADIRTTEFRETNFKRSKNGPKTVFTLNDVAPYMFDSISLYQYFQFKISIRIPITHFDPIHCLAVEMEQLGDEGPKITFKFVPNLKALGDALPEENGISSIPKFALISRDKKVFLVERRFLDKYPLCESLLTPKKENIRVCEEYDSKELHVLIQYLCTGSILQDELQELKSDQILELCKRLELKSLKVRMEQHLCQTLNLGNVSVYGDLAIGWKLSFLHPFVVTYVADLFYEDIQFLSIPLHPTIWSAVEEHLIQRARCSVVVPVSS